VRDNFYARIFLKQALELNPDFSRGWASLSFLELKRGNIFLFFRYLPKTWISFLKDYKNQVIFSSVVLKSFYIAGLISLFVLSIFLLIKYLPLIKDDLSRIIGEIALKSNGFLSVLAILLLPAILFLGWGLSSIIFIAFAWAYFSKKERRLAVIAVLIVSSGVIANQISKSFMAEVANFNNRKETGNKGVFILFAAQDCIERGDFNSAIKMLEDTNKNNPNLFSLINLGNIKVKAGEYEEGKKLYEKALMLYPNSNIPYSNLSILFDLLGEKNYAEKYKEKAINLKGNVNELKWINLSPALAWKWLLQKNIDFNRLLTSEMLFIFGACFIGVLLNIILKATPELYGESRFCLSCGKSINIHYDMKITNPDYCEECYRLFVWKPPELEIVRASKSREIKRKKIKEIGYYRILSILFPYSGLIKYNSPFLGYLGFEIFSFLLSIALLTKEMGYHILAFTFVLICIIVYIFSLFIYEKKVAEEWKEL
ncbi:MAG: tetratricopeptide repeat protein, partial [Candidatus Aminicenantia bacterium]